MAGLINTKANSTRLSWDLGKAWQYCENCSIPQTNIPKTAVCFTTLKVFNIQNAGPSEKSILGRVGYGL
jgi:hypothetical protein